MVQVERFFAHNELRNFSYVFYDDESGDAWVIDPYDPGPLALYLRKNQLNLKGILNTHSHFDHVRGNAALRDAFHAPVTKFSQGQGVVLTSQHRLEIWDTPGHTMDHQVFVWIEDTEVRALFSGDTLFNAGVGNCKNGGDPEALFHTTKQLLKKLPGATLLYPGHDYLLKNLEFSLSLEPENLTARERFRELEGSLTYEIPPLTLAEERGLNPFLRLNSEELRGQIGARPESSEKEIFITLRSLRDRW